MRKTIFTALMIMVLPGCGALAQTPGGDGRLDTSGIESVVVTGEASRVTLSSDPNRPLRAEIAGVRSGWFSRWLSGWSSSWFVDGCRSAATMRREGSGLLVDVPRSFGLSSCEVRLVANLPAGTALRIDQHAVLAALDGDFASVTVTGDAANVSLDGHAGEIALKGDAMRVRLDFRTASREETVSLEGKALDASLRFAAGTPISYAVEAAASFVDSALPDTPGARPAIRIKGDFVRATIR